MAETILKTLAERLLQTECNGSELECIYHILSDNGNCSPLRTAKLTVSFQQYQIHHGCFIPFSCQ
jgi:hypothetical protein